MLDSLPKADWMLADRGYDADWFREALHDKRRYRRRSRIAIMFGRLKDWRRVATQYHRHLETFFSEVILAATVVFWL